MPSFIVCGDIMLDQNLFVKAEKLANEAPIPVFGLQREEFALGGCGNVVKNLAGLGLGDVHVFSAVGCDQAGDQIETLVKGGGGVSHLRRVEGYTTTVKRRYFCDNKVIFRCDTEVFLSSICVPAEIGAEIEGLLKTGDVRCIFLSDYNKGFLKAELCQEILRLARTYGVFTCVDPKQDYTKYKGCSLIKPNRKEACALLQVDSSTPLLDLHKRMFSVVQPKYSVITLAENGTTLYDGVNMIHELPVVRKIIDVTGAGDVVCAVLGAFLCDGGDPGKVLRMATRIATKSVEFPGTYTATRADLAPASKVVGVDEARARTQGKRVIFTNGCFDLLHSGHISLFKYCKDLGGEVVVGLNSDASIRRLKGTTRPVNTLQTRLDVLEAIQYIDFIVVFEEDTPSQVLESLRPDILVKGGDYAVESIVGREFAGETRVCSFVEGVSSTATIQRIQRIQRIQGIQDP